MRSQPDMVSFLSQAVRLGFLECDNRLCKYLLGRRRGSGTTVRAAHARTPALLSRMPMA